ncbi:hypothetical protein BASA61_003967 [Batrachochytrium salamandrivorans]|nr:hypothetical protein BASA61_003967 [Batrachochytrium salamandrivorans]
MPREKEQDQLHMPREKEQDQLHMPKKKNIFYNRPKIRKIPSHQPYLLSKSFFKKIMDAFDAFQFGTSNKITPSCPDRTNSVKLRCPSRVSNSMLERMGMTAEDIAELRQIENRAVLM